MKIAYSYLKSIALIGLLSTVAQSYSLYKATNPSSHAHESHYSSLVSMFSNCFPNCVLIDSRWVLTSIQALNSLENSITISYQDEENRTQRQQYFLDKQNAIVCPLWTTNQQSETPIHPEHIDYYPYPWSDFVLIPLKEPITQVQPMKRARATQVEEQKVFLTSYEPDRFTRSVGVSRATVLANSSPIFMKYEMSLRAKDPLEARMDENNACDIGASVILENNLLVGLLSRINKRDNLKQEFAAENILGDVNAWLDSAIIEDALQNTNKNVETPSPSLPQPTLVPFTTTTGILNTILLDALREPMQSSKVTPLTPTPTLTLDTEDTHPLPSDYPASSPVRRRVETRQGKLSNYEEREAKNLHPAVRVDGTIIAPQWILTRKTPKHPNDVNVDGIPHKVDAVFRYPESELQLIHLDTGVDGISEIARNKKGIDVLKAYTLIIPAVPENVRTAPKFINMDVPPHTIQMELAEVGDNLILEKKLFQGSVPAIDKKVPARAGSGVFRQVLREGGLVLELVGLINSTVIDAAGTIKFLDEDLNQWIDNVIQWYDEGNHTKLDPFKLPTQKQGHRSLVTPRTQHTPMHRSSSSGDIPRLDPTLYTYKPLTLAEILLKGEDKIISARGGRVIQVLQETRHVYLDSFMELLKSRHNIKPYTFMLPTDHAITDLTPEAWTAIISDPECLWQFTQDHTFTEKFAELRMTSGNCMSGIKEDGRYRITIGSDQDKLVNLKVVPWQSQEDFLTLTYTLENKLISVAAVHQRNAKNGDILFIDTPLISPAQLELLRAKGITHVFRNAKIGSERSQNSIWQQLENTLPHSEYSEFVALLRLSGFQELLGRSIEPDQFTILALGNDQLNQFKDSLHISEWEELELEDRQLIAKHFIIPGRVLIGLQPQNFYSFSNHRLTFETNYSGTRKVRWNLDYPMLFLTLSREAAKMEGAIGNMIDGENGLIYCIDKGPTNFLSFQEKFRLRIKKN